MNASPWLRFALATLCSTGFGLAQEERPDPTVRQVNHDGSDRKGGKEGRSEKDILSEEAEKNLTPEQRLARHVSSGAGSYCRFVSSMRPAKLLPGQSGTVLVVAALQGAAVIPSPAPFELLSKGQVGAVTLGGMTIRPADVGVLAAGYRGRPVYENTMVMEFPVTMSPEAKLGEKVSFSIDFRFDLYDGVSAQPIGRFVDHAIVEAEVGAVPDPTVAAFASKGAAAEPVSSEPKPVSGAPSEPTKPEALAGHATPVVTAPAPEPAPAAAPTASTVAPPHEDGEGSLPVGLIAGGGAVLLVLVLLLARKK